MKKRAVRNFDKNIVQTFKAMRNAVVQLGFQFENVDKDRYIIEIKTKSSYIFFGAHKYVLSARSVSEKNTQVMVVAKSDVSQKNLDELAEDIFMSMDKELPIASS